MLLVADSGPLSLCGTVPAGNALTATCTMIRLDFLLKLAVRWLTANQLVALCALTRAH